MRKVKVLIVFLLAANVSTTFAQKKEKIKGDRNVMFIQSPIENYHTLEIGEELEVVLVQGQMSMVEVEADRNLHEVINFVSVNGKLSVQTTKRITSKKELKIRIYHTALLTNIIAKEDTKISSLGETDLQRLDITSSNSAELYLTLKANEFKLTASQKTRAELNITSQNSAFVLSDDAKVKALINGGECKMDLYQDAKADIEGDVRRFTLRVDNTSTFEGEKFTAANASLIAEGRSDTRINASDGLSVEASGSSRVYIYNTPRITLEKFQGEASLYKKN